VSPNLTLKQAYAAALDSGGDTTCTGLHLGTEVTVQRTELAASLRSLGPKWPRTELTKERSGCRPLLRHSMGQIIRSLTSVCLCVCVIDPVLRWAQIVQPVDMSTNCL